MREVYVHADGVAHILTCANELTGEPLVPGFRVPVADLFPLPEPSP